MSFIIEHLMLNFMTCYLFARCLALFFQVQCQRRISWNLNFLLCWTFAWFFWIQTNCHLFNLCCLLSYFKLSLFSFLQRWITHYCSTQLNLRIFLMTTMYFWLYWDPLTSICDVWWIGTLIRTILTDWFRRSVLFFLTCHPWKNIS